MSECTCNNNNNNNEPPLSTKTNNEEYTTTTTTTINHDDANNNLDELYPFTKTQINFLLSLKHHVSISSCSNSTTTTSSSSLSLSTIFQDATMHSNLEYESQQHIQAIQWMDNNLLSLYNQSLDNNTTAIYQSKHSLLYDLFISAKQYSHVLLFDNDNENDIHLYLETMSALSGRKCSELDFEIKVLFDFIWKRHQCQERNNNNNTNNNNVGLVHQNHDKKIDTNGNKSYMNDMNDKFDIDIQLNTFDKDDTIPIYEMISFIYRLALSCHVLQNWSISSTSDDDDDCTPNNNKRNNLNLDYISSLGMTPPKIMIDSLGSYEIQSNNNVSSLDLLYYDGSTNDSSNDIVKTEVNYETFRDWVDMYFPNLGCILSTFIHLLLLPSIGHQGDNIPINDNTDDQDDTLTQHHYLNNNNIYEYAQGKRKMFQFPQLHQLIMEKSIVHNTISQRIIATPPISSVFFEAQSYSETNSNNNHNHDNKYVQDDVGHIGDFAFCMACMDSNLNRAWCRLYSTETNGFAFLNMQRALTGYTGPTIMIIRPTVASSAMIDEKRSSPGLFGFYTSNPWKESKTFYGNSDCFLFRADPIWNVYRPKCFVQGWKNNNEQTTYNSSSSSSSLPPLHKQKSKENYMYFNPSAGHVNAGRPSGGYGYETTAKPQGLVLGGTMEQPRLYISESFEKCIASSGVMMDMTFESGPLLPGQWDKYFNIDVLEVWGVGGEDIVSDAIEAKEKHEDIVDAARKRVQRVDKKQFLEDFKSGLHVDNKLFDHRFDSNVRYDYD